MITRVMTLAPGEGSPLSIHEKVEYRYGKGVVVMV
jgi:hypothetical protein